MVERVKGENVFDAVLPGQSKEIVIKGSVFAGSVFRKGLTYLTLHVLVHVQPVFCSNVIYQYFICQVRAVNFCIPGKGCGRFENDWVRDNCSKIVLGQKVRNQKALLVVSVGAVCESDQCV